MAYTLLQLQQMGATPVSTTATPNQQSGYTQNQLQNMGATPTGQNEGFQSGTLAPGLNKTGEGIKDVATSIKNVLTGNASDQNTNQAVQGGLKTVAGATEIAGAIPAGFFQALAHIPLPGTDKNVGDILGTLAPSNVFKPTIDAVSNSKVLQDLTTKYPNLPESTQNFIETLSALVGLEKGPEAVKGVSTAIDESAANSLKAPAPKSAESEVMPFDQKLQNAQQSIYTKLSPTEKSTLPLTDSSKFKTSTPDLLQDPQSKQVIESVANLPEDIQVNPSQSLAVRESNLQQGISRLHQDTDNYLFSKKMETSFNDATYGKFTKERFLDPIRKEFGADSQEYKAATEIDNLGKSKIETNDGHGVYTGRQALNSDVSNEYPRAFQRAKNSLGNQLDPRTNAIIEAAREYPKIMNDFISEKLLKENDPYRARLKEESRLITAKEQMRTRSAGEVDKGKVGQFLKKHPIVKEVAKTAEKVLPLGGILKMADHL